ncbi:C4-dicarboxylate ABC transporter [Marinomonas ushuaiensis DSM 15871]|uniref:TRAP transporter small permease protein n=1 Tax=Marinomonas ushuaiensis DSM 15871 TaxID=1122207 RepID=X7E4V9_9GAMM|nr:C4-dicarboxylate ABC transporter [Marinomonas ushuaiensis DSM 15871]
MVFRLEKIFLGLSLALMVTLLSAGVFFRYVLNDPIVWSESIAKLLIVWMTFLGASIAFSEKSHIRVDSLVDYFPFKARQIIKHIVELFTVSIVAYMGYLGFIYFETTITSTSPILGISIGYFSFGMPILFAFSVFHILVNYISNIDKSEETQTC